MTAQPKENEVIEVVEYTSDVITEDGEIITPTPSRTRSDVFERLGPRILFAVGTLVVVIIGFTMAFSMAYSSQKNEITSTTYDSQGFCKSVHSFMIAGNESGEDPTLFAKYRASHPNELPLKANCPIIYENNTSKH